MLYRELAFSTHPQIGPAASHSLQGLFFLESALNKRYPHTPNPTNPHGHTPPQQKETPPLG